MVDRTGIWELKISMSFIDVAVSEVYLQETTSYAAYAASDSMFRT
jgi:hypothetical protein